jgi:hypothetical protein
MLFETCVYIFLNFRKINSRGLESWGLFRLAVVWFIGLDPIEFFPMDFFVLYSIRNSIFGQTSCNESLGFLWCNQMHKHPIKLKWTWQYNLLFFFFTIVREGPSIEKQKLQGVLGNELPNDPLITGCHHKQKSGNLINIDHSILHDNEINL